MKKFLVKLTSFFAVLFLVLELGCMLFVDDYYFNKLNLYNSNKPNKVIFIGPSRVPASIDKKVFSKYNMNCVVAGRGYITGGTHLVALEYNLKKNPDYLKNARVFVEYPNNVVFAQDAEKYKYQVFEPKFSQFDAAMPHVILPYLDPEGLKNFFADSPNSFSVKVKLFFLYCFSSYRCMLMLQEKEPIKYLTKKIFSGEPILKTNLTGDGGIKSSNFEKARQKAIIMAKSDSLAQSQNALLTQDVLERSILAEMNRVITKGGGKLFLFNMPLHSVQQNISNSGRASENKEIFLHWLDTKGIEMIESKGFVYGDDDFPDTWHLSVDRRSEFSTRLAQEILQQKIVIASNNQKNK